MCCKNWYINKTLGIFHVLLKSVPCAKNPKISRRKVPYRVELQAQLR